MTGVLCTVYGAQVYLNDLTKDMLLLIHWKSFEYSTWLTREMFIWLKNSTLGISNSEDYHYLYWRLVADYPGHVTTYFCTQCWRPVQPKNLICDIWHSIKIKYPYTKPQSPTPFNSNSHPSCFCTKLWSKTQGVWGSILCLAATISEIGYLLLPSRDMAEISLKRRKSSKQPTTNHKL